METNYNETTHKKEWNLINWYEKLFYIVGIFCTIYIAIAFTVGFIMEIAGF